MSFISAAMQRISGAILALSILCASALAEPSGKEAAKSEPGYFSPSFSVNSFFSEASEGQKVESDPTKPVHVESPAANVEARAQLARQVNEKSKPAFVNADPASHIMPPDQDPKVRINPEAPGPFVAMADAYQNGDQETAKQYARQFVRYLVNLIFQAKELTHLIGEAMVEEGSVDEESWVGVEQYLDYELASARQATDAPVRATHEEAMKRVKPDPQGEAEIYFFFTLNCSWCRKMAPDVERLWQVTKDDPKVRMVALTLGPAEKEWVEAYRKYTGLTIPVLDGKDVAKQFRVAFVPAVVIAAPNSQTAYLKTGQQDFSRLYEFVRTVQGQSPAMTERTRNILVTPIGEVEKAQKKGIDVISVSAPTSVTHGAAGSLVPANGAGGDVGVLQKF